MRRRHALGRPLTDRQLADLYERIRGQEPRVVEATLAHHGVDVIDAIIARRAVRRARSGHSDMPPIPFFQSTV